MLIKLGQVSVGFQIFILTYIFLSTSSRTPKIKPEDNYVDKLFRLNPFKTLGFRLSYLSYAHFIHSRLSYQAYFLYFHESIAKVLYKHSKQLFLDTYLLVMPFLH